MLEIRYLSYYLTSPHVASRREFYLGVQVQTGVSAWEPIDIVTNDFYKLPLADSKYRRLIGTNGSMVTRLYTHTDPRKWYRIFSVSSLVGVLLTSSVFQLVLPWASAGVRGLQSPTMRLIDGCTIPLPVLGRRRVACCKLK